MSELFNKEENAQKESLKDTSRVHTSSHKPTKKYAMKIKETKKKQQANVIDGRKPFIRHIQRTGENDLNELRVNNSGHNGDGFSSVGTRTGAIKLTLAGAQDWWC